MTTVAHDMVHYGTLGRTKNISEAKLNVVLENTKRRHTSSPPPPPSAKSTHANASSSLLSSPSPSHLATPNEEDALVMPRKRRNPLYHNGLFVGIIWDSVITLFE
ncbi:hypothetical protein K474DRAFT_1678206 [Panus rudis PR-1116 ss-1]|nr:hypothetical protein K474DRAFT_1678206 [Panus rudis PR-1116 ss-1]